MPSKLTNLALVFAILALAVSAYSLTREGGTTGDGGGPTGSPERLADLERRVDRLAQAVEELRGQSPGLPEPAAEVTDLDSSGGVGGPAAPEDRLKALVDDAVEKKARSVTEELLTKEDKKPLIEAFASVLELSSAQRDSVEQEVIRGQQAVYAILETPTADGRNLLADLVELYAESIANPGRDPGWGRWIARVVTEKVPGSDETYAAKIEPVKASMRNTFRRIMSEKQYAEFVDWGVDPVEIRDITGSPQEALALRIQERARVLGAKLPEEEGE